MIFDSISDNFCLAALISISALCIYDVRVSNTYVDNILV